jgi:hypothetical protein
VYLEPDPILPADEDVLPGLWLHARGDPYHVVDPDGRCGLVGAAVGGALGAALSGAFALYNGDDPATALARAVVGGVGGSVLGATCGLAASAGAGGVVGAFQGGVNTALDARGAPLTLAELGRGALVGGVGGALAGVAGGHLGGRTDLNAAGRLTLNTYADLGADLLAQGAGTALGGGPLDLERAIFAAAFGTGVRAVHLGGASAVAAVRARMATARDTQRRPGADSPAQAQPSMAFRALAANQIEFLPTPRGVDQTPTSPAIERPATWMIGVVDDRTTLSGSLPRIAGLLPGPKSATAWRKSPGTAFGTDLPVVTGRWLRGSHGNSGMIPQRIAQRLSGRSFASFDDFRGALWREVAADSGLASQFSRANAARMRRGLAPITHSSQQYGGLSSYILHHRTPIEAGGAVFDMTNIRIVTPRLHQAVHYGQ